jgi:hypothetical protein
MSTHEKKHKKAIKREFVTAENGETYAIIKSIKGDTRFDVEIIRTGKIVIAKARGSLIKGPGKQRLHIGDTILIQEGEQAYILTKYLEEEVKKLTKMGELISFKPKVAGDTHIIFEDDVLDKEIDEIVFDDDFIGGL